jgi:hypothetical protein
MVWPGPAAAAVAGLWYLMEAKTLILVAAAVWAF